MSQQQFAKPKSPAELNSSGPSLPSHGNLYPGTLPKMDTGDHYSDLIGGMILVMSVAHGQGQDWHSVPYHILFVAWLYRELGQFAQPPIPETVPDQAIDPHIAVLWQDPEKVTAKSANRSLVNATRKLVDEGYVLSVREGGNDHLIPTDKLVEAIVKD